MILMLHAWDLEPSLGMTLRKTHHGRRIALRIRQEYDATVAVGGNVTRKGQPGLRAPLLLVVLDRHSKWAWCTRFPPVAPRS